MDGWLVKRMRGLQSHQTVNYVTCLWSVVNRVGCNSLILCPQVVMQHLLSILTAPSVVTNSITMYSSCRAVREGMANTLLRLTGKFSSCPLVAALWFCTDGHLQGRLTWCCRRSSFHGSPADNDKCWPQGHLALEEPSSTFSQRQSSAVSDSSKW